MSVGAGGVPASGVSKGLHVTGKSSRRHHNLPEVEVQHRFSRTDQLLISAARDGDTSLVLELLACTHTININARDRKSGSTALIVASAWNHPKIVSVLLDKGADPTLHNFEGRSALEVAATTEISLLLLGCLPKSFSPSTLLQQAAWQGNLPLVEQVLCNRDNVDLEACNNEGLNALLLATRDVKVFYALFQQNLLNTYDPAEVVKHLLNSGVNINHKDLQGRTSLHYSVSTVNSDVSVKIIKLLLKFGADPNATDKHSFTPLHFAVKSKFLTATEILLAHGADVNKQTYAGHSTLHIASSVGDVKLAAILLENGARISAITHSGLTPFKCAANQEMYALLKSAAIENEFHHHVCDNDSSLQNEQTGDGKDSSKGCRKSRNGHRHKTSNSVKKQLLFTMHLGLAVSKSPNSDDLKGNLAQSRESSSKPLSAPLPSRSSPLGLPSRIPITVAKFGSNETRAPRQTSPLRSRSCSNCELEEPKADIHSDSSDEAKSSAVPDVLRSTSNLPLCGRNLRRHRRYVNSKAESSDSREGNCSRFTHHSPSRKIPANTHKEDGSETPDAKKQVQNLLLIFGGQAQKSENITVADYQKMKKHSQYVSGDSDLISYNKPSVQFLIDSKQAISSGNRRRVRHRVNAKRGKIKSAKSDSEVETKSISPIKGEPVSFFPSINNSPHSKIVSRLPRKCKDSHSSIDHSKDASNDFLKGALIGHKIPTCKTSTNKVVDQFRAISLQATPSESTSTLDASISSDCVSQVSAASWIYVPNEEAPSYCQRAHPPPSTLPGLSGSHSNTDIAGKSYWRGSDDFVCEDDILIEDESPEHLYDCPLTPPPSLNCRKKHSCTKTDACCTELDSENDMLFQWSSDGCADCATPVGTVPIVVEDSKQAHDDGLKKFEGQTSEECLAALQGESDHQLSISWAKGKLLGRGSYGMVWCGLTASGDLIAVKQIKINAKGPQQATEEYLQIQQEFKLLQQLNHRNIVSYLGIQLEGTTVSIFMPFFSGGSLSHNLSQFGPFMESVISRYTKQILEGVGYLHSNGIIHRDIKGANIMIMPSESGGLIKLIDFGCAKPLHMNFKDSNHYIQSVRGTPYWMAPEVIQQAGCTEKSDIWSLGCVLIEMSTTKPPFSSLPPFSAAYAIGQGTSKPKIPTNLSPVARDFIGSTMRRNPDARPMAYDLLKHSFLTESYTSGSLKSTE